jgi:hypothetical protein
LIAVPVLPVVVEAVPSREEAMVATQVERSIVYQSAAHVGVVLEMATRKQRR